MPGARAHLHVSGRVQGVFFRTSCRERAALLRLSGWVRNLPDGRVEAVAEGDRGKVEDLISWCREGPPGARVRHVEVSWEEPRGESGGFRVSH